MYAVDSINKISAVDSFFYASKRLEVAGHTWTIAASSLPSFEAQLAEEKSQSIVVAGLAVSILLGCSQDY
jgi:hypothetical protein